MCFDDECLEPPVSVGLSRCDDSLDAIAEFYEIPYALVAAAAEKSPPLPETDRSTHVALTSVSRRRTALVYHEAASQLKELGETLGDEFAQQQLAKLMQRYSRYSAFKRELRAAGFDP